MSARALSDMERGRSRGPQHRTVLAIAGALNLDEAVQSTLVELAREGRLRDHWVPRPSGLCELPRSIDDFIGRSAELAWMSGLAHASDQAHPGAASVALVTGPGGLGKTTLAIRTGHALRPRFPDGVLFVDLLGMSARPTSADEILFALLKAIGAADQQIPADTDSRASLYRALLRDRRFLVILDNAASEEQVRPVLPGHGQTQTVVTSRRLLAGLEGVRRLALGPLALTDATELLNGILRDRPTPDTEVASTQLAELCGGLPLALRIAGNRLLSRPQWTAADLSARLNDEDRRLDQLSAGDLKIAAVFALSYDQLASNAQRLFRRLALVPGRDFDAHLAAVLGDMTLDDAWDALDDLVDLGLLHDATGSRYRFHDLVRLFARHRLHSEDSADLRKTVQDAMTTWLLRNATAAGRWFEPAYSSPPESADLAPLSTMDDADRWLRTEAENWLAALRTAADAGRHDTVLDCAESMHWFSDRWMHGPHWQEVFTLGADAAAALGDLAQQATQLNYLAWVHLVPRGATVATNLGPLNPEIAARYAGQALDLATRSGATAQVGWSHYYTANALRMSGRLDEGTMAAGKAADVFKAVGDIDGYCQCLSYLAYCLRDAGRYDEALRVLGERHDLENDENTTMTPSITEYGQPLTLIRIGECLGLLGRRAEAITALTRAVRLLEKFPVSTPHTIAWEMLAGVLADESRTAESRQAYARAAEAFNAIGDADASRRCHDLATAAS